MFVLFPWRSIIFSLKKWWQEVENRALLFFCLFQSHWLFAQTFKMCSPFIIFCPSPPSSPPLYSWTPRIWANICLRFFPSSLDQHGEYLAEHYMTLRSEKNTLFFFLSLFSPVSTQTESSKFSFFKKRSEYCVKRNLSVSYFPQSSTTFFFFFYSHNYFIVEKIKKQLAERRPAAS